MNERLVMLGDVVLKRVSFVATAFAVTLLAIMTVHHTFLKLLGATADADIVQLSGKLILVFAVVAAASTVTRKAVLAPMLRAKIQ